MNARNALDAIAAYVDAKNTADCYPTDKDTEKRLDALADNAAQALKSLAAQ